MEKAVPLSNNPYSVESIARRRTMHQLGDDSIVSLRSESMNKAVGKGVAFHNLSLMLTLIYVIRLR